MVVPATNKVKQQRWNYSMNEASQLSVLNFSTDRVGRLVLGWVCIFLGGGVLMFWNVERSIQWPFMLILVIGAFFLGFGIFLIGYRRSVLLEAGKGVSEVQTFFGKLMSRKLYHLAEFDSVGCHGTTTDLLYLDVALFKKRGGFVMLRSMVSNGEARREIDRVAHHLGLKAEVEPRVRGYLIAGLD